MEMMKFYVSLQDFFQSSYTGNLKEVALIIGFTLLFLVALSKYIYNYKPIYKYKECLLFNNIAKRILWLLLDIEIQ